jgi:hypothetical protein
MQTSGQSGSADGMELATSDIQDLEVLLSEGWNFVYETVNGLEDILWIFEGKNYPRLR